MTTKPRIRRKHLQPSSQAWGDTAHCQPGPTTYRVLMIPLDPASVEAMVEKGRLALIKAWVLAEESLSFEQQARVVIHAIHPSLKRK